MSETIFNLAQISKNRCHLTVLSIFSLKQRRFKTIAWIWSYHLHLQWKFKLLAGKFTWGNKTKHCWLMSTNFLFKSLLTMPSTSNKLSHLWFKFSLKVKVKVIGSNPGYLLKYFLVYHTVFILLLIYKCAESSSWPR